MVTSSALTLTSVKPAPTPAGADVVGLDSQGRSWNSTWDRNGLHPAEALMYDQYTLISINPATDNPMERLVGKPGQYYQGKFRFYAPCEWGPFDGADARAQAARCCRSCRTGCSARRSPASRPNRP